MCPQWKQYVLEVSYQLPLSSGPFLQALRERRRHELGLVTASFQVVPGFLGLVGRSPLWVPRSWPDRAAWLLPKHGHCYPHPQGRLSEGLFLHLCSEEEEEEGLG